MAAVDFPDLDGPTRAVTALSGREGQLAQGIYPGGFVLRDP
ncbi:hypothetical protein [Dethiosulfovibrio peptidovorans]|nr:hypothetical protein [Dethiosulfovibrio peptidovorans]